MSRRLLSQERPLWRCPRCGHRYVTRNMWHSCRKTVPLHRFFQGRPPALRRIFDRLRRQMRDAGHVTTYGRLSGIVFQVRVRFAGVRVRRRWVEVSLWLERRVRHPQLVKAVPFRDLNSHGYGHYFRFTSPDQLDRDFAALVRESYRVGAQISRNS